MLIVHDYSIKIKSTNDHSTQKEIVFFVWNKHGIRADTISKYLGACLYLLYTSPIKHPILFIKTLCILRKVTPKIIICQSPPITCALVALSYKYLFSRKVKPKIIVDAHRSTFYKSWVHLKLLSRFIMRRAVITIVHNVEIQNRALRDYGVKSIILEDPIPEFDDTMLNNKKANSKNWENNYGNSKTLKVAVINPFTFDAPLKEILAAASELRSAVIFYFTGEFSSRNNKLRKGPENVILTGFLPKSEYVALLRLVDVIMDLTLDPDAMEAGAYEAVAAGKVLIASDNAPLRRYFNKGTIYINNSSHEIKEALSKAVEKKDELEREMQELKLERQKEWKEKFTNNVIKLIE